MLENAGWQERGNFMLVFWTPERILMDECNANGTPYAAPAKQQQHQLQQQFQLHV